MLEQLLPLMTIHIMPGNICHIHIYYVLVLGTSVLYCTLKYTALCTEKGLKNGFDI